MSLAEVSDRISASRIFTAIEATWPPARWEEADGWRIPDGSGGGKRVSAARATTEAPSIRILETAQRALGQAPLVMVPEGSDRLDATLDAEGYGVVDPTVALVAPISGLSREIARVTAYEVAWPPLEFQREIWAAAGIGPARLAVMSRARGEHVSLLGRKEDAPCATVFVACDGDIAMVHALEVAAGMRRRGLGRDLMTAAALWAETHGAKALAVLVTEANAPARSLYAAMGFQRITGYHYRARPVAI